MRILLLGKNGQLGWELNRTLMTLGQVTAVGYPEINLEKEEAVRDLVRQVAPECIVNAAAYTGVDQAEVERDRAVKINAIAPHIIGLEAKRLGAAFIHFSTDYVFDGRKGSPYMEEDIPNPLNIYGSSKLQGEQAIQSVDCDYLIFRTSWVYSLRKQAGFVNKMLLWARQHETLRVVDDQISNPTWARMLAEITAQIIARGDHYMHERKGIYHLAGDGYASRFEWAREIIDLDVRKEEQMVKQFESAKTVDFPAPAERPLFSALDCSNFISSFGLCLPNWRQALFLCCTEKQK